MPDLKRVATLAGLDEPRLQGWVDAGFFEQAGERTEDWVARALVLAQLEKLGVPRRVIRAAGTEDVLGRAYIFDLVQLARQDQHALPDVLERVALDERLFLRLCEALGIDDTSSFSEEEVVFFEALAEALQEGLPTAMGIELCEIWGTQMRFIAAAEVTSYDTNVARQTISDSPSPLEGAAMLAALTRAMLRAADLIPQPLHRRHLLQEIDVQREAPGGEPGSGLAPGEVDIAIAFVDLTGYTSLTQQEGDRQALTYARRLERIVRTYAHVRGVRIVKRLGDGFMLASQSAPEMVTAILQIVGIADEREDLPAARAAVAFGRAVSRAGDYFGHTVNLAARVLNEAEPSEVLVTEEVVNESDGGPFAFRQPRDCELRGLTGTVRAWTAEPAGGGR